MHWCIQVLSTIKDLATSEGAGLEYVRLRLSRLTTKELSNVRCTAAYLYTLLRSDLEHSKDDSSPAYHLTLSA